MSRERNRQQFPTVARVVDQFRSVFGPVKVFHATENGRTLGRDPIKERQPRPEFEREYAEENRAKFGGYPENLRK